MKDYSNQNRLGGTSDSQHEEPKVPAVDSKLGFDRARLKRHLAGVGVVLGTLSQNGDFNFANVALQVAAPPAHDELPVINIILSSELTAISSQFCEVLESRLVHILDLIGRYLATYGRETPFFLTFNTVDTGGSTGLCFDRPAGTDWPLMPDLYLLAANPVDQSPDFAQDFAKRKPILFWRGTTTGGGYRSRADLLASYRVATCRRLRELLGERADCRISRVTQLQGYSYEDATAALVEAGVLGDFVTEAQFADYQMFVDLPGNAAAWGTGLKYLAGCLVLRPPCSRELSYTHLLEPWRHFIPIEADMSDVGERIAWVDSHKSEASAIAARGQALLSDVVRRIPETMMALFKQNNEMGHDISASKH